MLENFRANILKCPCEQFRIQVCFQIEAKGSCGITSQGKRRFWLLPKGFGKSLIFLLFVLAKK